MPKRPKQHQLEDLSRNKYNLLLPRNWVMRDKDKDYGIDAEVEIFDDMDQPTGLVYWVQLKATESKDTAVAKRIDLRIDTIKYYKSLDIPVLIVRYSEKEDFFYCKWAHEIDLFYAKKGAKTRRITFSEDDIWVNDTAISITKYLKKIRAIKEGNLALPVPLSIVVKNDVIGGISRGVFMAAYRQAILSYPQIAKYQSNSEKALLHVTLDSKKLFISLASVGECTFHSIEDRETEGFADGIAADVLLGLAASLATIGQTEMAARIFLDSQLKERFVQKQELLRAFIPRIIRTSRYGDVIDLACEMMIDSSDDNTIESIVVMSALVAMDKDDPEKCEKFHQLLNKCLEKNIALGEKPLIGTSHYNLGNYYRAACMFKEAIAHYLLARKFESKYLNQSYFFRELGGTLFEYGKYRFAANMYKQALNKGSPESTKPLYADALMLGGKYELAHEVFSEYLDSSDDNHPEWHLKKVVLAQLITEKGLPEQIRHKNKAIKLVSAAKAHELSFVDDLEKAIKMDNLCGPAWFNLGFKQNEEGKNEEAAFSFVVCGVVDKWNITSWVNATLCSLNKDLSANILYLILNTAYFFNGDTFLSKLHEELDKQLDRKLLIEFTNVIDELLQDHKITDDPVALRVMHEDGIFRDIITADND